LSSEHFWGTPTSSSWPECGAIPRDVSDEGEKDIDENTYRVIAYSDVAGAQFIDRLNGESLQDFITRIDITMNIPPTTSEAPS
jgi:hypothetical protein